MDITPAEARASLGAIDEAVDAHRRAIDRLAAQIVLVWGVTYCVAPLAMHFWPVPGPFVLNLLVVVAIGYTVMATSRQSPVTGPNVRRSGAVWGIVYGFGTLWFCVLSPWGSPHAHGSWSVSSEQMWAYGVTLAMMVYVVMGLWVGRFYVLLGLAVTATTAFGLFALGDAYWIWCSITGGGAMIAAGLYLRKVSSPS
ncbi:MAG: hypothetical protein R3C10_18625 [Pirellulales bacterium]